MTLRLCARHLAACRRRFYMHGVLVAESVCTLCLRLAVPKDSDSPAPTYRQRVRIPLGEMDG